MQFGLYIWEPTSLYDPTYIAQAWKRPVFILTLSPLGFVDGDDIGGQRVTRLTKVTIMGSIECRQTMPDDVISTPRQPQTSVNLSEMFRFW